MLLDNGFWKEVINGSSNLVIAGSMVIQTVIFLITFRIGTKHLTKYRSKKRLKKITDTKLLLIKYRHKIDKLYNIPFDLQKKIEESPEKNKEDLIRHLQIIFEEKSDIKESIELLTQHIRLNISLINSPGLKEEFEYVSRGFYVLELHFNSLFRACTKENPSNWFEFFKAIPKSTSSNLGGHLNLGKRKYKELHEMLTELYNQA